MSLPALVMVPVSAGAASDVPRELGFVFTVKGGISNAIPLDQQGNSPELVTEGQVYTLDELDTVLKATDNTAAGGDTANPEIPGNGPALFSDAVLTARFMDRSVEYDKEFDITSCNELSFLPQEIENGPLSQRVKCDGRIYSSLVENGKIVVYENQKVALEIDLGEDHFTLNGQEYVRSY